MFARIALRHIPCCEDVLGQAAGGAGSKDVDAPALEAGGTAHQREP
ncbi:hypothetical protein DES41_102947 [Pseudorhodoferax soli]|uniref:Uncharacterized protein n=2 Tax=Pseudorhodoferax soli TaxID=545864 RepID=A0A368Y8W4_9BURK|nr:hypothetical protein DES41_102947 [Pseudorhodoferax soli]